MKTVEVVCAIIKKENTIYAARRGYGAFINQWEFPGGKVEAGETKEEALHREIMEELSISISIESFFTSVDYDYPDFHLTMHCYLCRLLDKEPILSEHTDAKWLSFAQLDSVSWLPANLSIIEKIKRIEGIRFATS